MSRWSKCYKTGVPNSGALPFCRFQFQPYFNLFVIIKYILKILINQFRFNWIDLELSFTVRPSGTGLSTPCYTVNLMKPVKHVQIIFHPKNLEKQVRIVWIWKAKVDGSEILLGIKKMYFCILITPVTENYTFFLFVFFTFNDN